MGDDDTDVVGIIKFKKDVKELKIPKNYDAMPANEEITIEFIVEKE